MSMQAVSGESEVFPEGPWMQDWTIFPLSFSADVEPNKPSFDGPANRALALGFREDLFIWEIK